MTAINPSYQAVTPSYTEYQAVTPSYTEPHLSREHRRKLCEESAISSEVVSARGYRTAASLDEVPKAFAKWQRRVGLVIPSYSPDGVSVSYQLRPDKPIVRKTGKAPKYESPSGAATTL